MRHKYSLLFFVVNTLSILATMLLYSSLPLLVPIHWNIHGQIDSWGNKNLVIITAFIPIIIYFLFLYYYKKRKYEKTTVSATYFVLFNGMMLSVHWYIIGAALNKKTATVNILLVLVGMFFIGIGNYMPRIQKNYLIGIRTPWTFKSNKVWKRSNRIGGKLFFTAGSFIFIVGLLNQIRIAFFVMILLLLGNIVLVLYGYTLSKKTQS